ncbi:MAG TPA: hypothetical protein VGY54_21035, partial [Polyangiaceae bacterium]|nr:hypothetical protein [Polyangiaceae bacterium]
PCRFVVAPGCTGMRLIVAPVLSGCLRIRRSFACDNLPHPIDRGARQRVVCVVVPASHRDPSARG